MSTVSIVCADASHAGRRATVATFVHDGQRWDETLPATHEASMDLDRATVDGLTGVTPLPDWREPQPDPGTVRQRFNGVCPLCHLTVPVRVEKLGPVLTRLADHGVGYIDLAHLAAIVR